MEERGMKLPKESCGVINAHELYRLKTAMELLGVGYKAFTAMRRQGLPIIKAGNRKFISGRQLIEFMEGRAHVESQGACNPVEPPDESDTPLE